MFRLIEQSSGQNQSIGTFSECVQWKRKLEDINH